MLSEPKNRGKGVKPGLSWGTTGHTNRLVPLFAQGAGANRIAAALVGVDSLQGPYTDNALLGATLQMELGKIDTCQGGEAERIHLKLERDRLILPEGQEGFYELRLFDSRGRLRLSLGREWKPAEGLEWKLPSFKGLSLVVLEGPGGRWEEAVFRP